MLYFTAFIWGRRAMQSSVVKKRSIVLGGRKTSVSLEDEFWNSLRKIALRRDESLYQLVANIDAERQFANLSSVLRMFVLGHYRDQLNQQNEMVAPLVPSNSIEAR
jgi:predicted DNA-binding ribbon-helix-helix protein